MDHVLIEKKEQCFFALNALFAQHATRSNFVSKIPNCDTDVFQCIEKIYKRGFFLGHENDLLPQVVFFKKEALWAEIFSLAEEKTFFIIDQHFFSLHLAENWKGVDKRKFLFCATESNKNLDSVIEIMASIPKKTTQIMAIGGGVTIDVAGFVAGLLKLRFSCVATTLLASVDAAFGGKTGVNYPPYGKNQVGLFYGCHKMIVVPEFFSSLSKRDVLCGLAESLKHAWLVGEFYVHKPLFEKILSSFESLSFSEWSAFIQWNHAVKSFFVQSDPDETNGWRSLLNFGHTVAHVLEGLADQKIIQSPMPHGIAVAWGMLFLRKNRLIENDCSGFFSFLEKLVCKSGVDLRVEKNEFKQIIAQLLAQDKKNKPHGAQWDRVCLVLPWYGIINSRKV